jgi:solute carrier family 25 protein 38
MFKEVPYAALFLPLYQKYKTIFSLSTARPTESGFVKFPSAFLAGATATAITQPLDMVRSRIQLKPVEYKGFFQASSKIISQEGFLVLFTGALPRLARKSLQSAITWTTFELLVKS